MKEITRYKKVQLNQKIFRTFFNVCGDYNKNDTNLYVAYNRHDNDPNSHTATANGYYTFCHTYLTAS